MTPREPEIATFPASDGYRWHFRHYSTPVTTRAVVVGIHGIQSHGGWYLHSCQRLAEAGFPVWFLDRRGSGLNTEARGDASRFRRLLDDLAEFIVHLRRQQTGKKIILLAISWGGKLAVALQRRFPGLCNGLALLCPGFFPRMRPSLRQRLAIAWSRLIRPGRLYPIPLNDPELFTASPRWLEFLRQDPLSLHKATARFLVASVFLDRYLRRTPACVLVPTLLMLAGQDRIIDNDKTRAFVEQFAGPRDIIEYPEAHHTLEFEPNPDRFLGDLLAWLSKQAP